MIVQHSVITAAIPYTMTKHLIAVVGPTAIGKTALSIKIADHFQTEIISADSRQFYKEMRIGTAVPESEELLAAKHHCIQHISIEDMYSVGHFEREALQLLDGLFEKHQQVVMVGGSGMYVDAIINGLDVFPDVLPGTREQLQTLFESDGIEALQRLLKIKDPVYYEQVDLSNQQRVMRALEVCLSAKAPFSSFRNQPKAKRPFDIIKIGLQTDRSIMYDRINKRVDLMIQGGLVEEARNLLSRKHTNALQTVGYRELFEYFEGKVTLEQAIENIKTNTRRFAKRQLTWYRKDEHIVWFDYQTEFAEIAAFITKKTS